MRIGFIGLGHMGAPMVLNLLKHDHCVTVFDINPDAMSALQAQGALLAASLNEVAVQADIVITMLQTHQQVSSCCLGENGFFDVLASQDTLYIDCSTVGIDASRALHEQADQLGIAMLDAPVSGGVAAAQSAQLTFMVGGSEDYYCRAQPVLSQLGKAVIHVGEAGNGAAAKICNNLILAVSMVAVSEGFALAKHLGLEAEKLFEVCSQSSAQCWSLTQYCPEPGVLPHVPSSHDYKAGFTANMMLKDLKLSQSAVAGAQMAKGLPMSATATRLYQQLVNKGFGEKDFSAIICLLKGCAVEEGQVTEECAHDKALRPDGHHSHDQKPGDDKVEEL